MIALCVLVVSYIILFTEKLNRAVTVLLGTSFLIFCGVLTQETAISSIDFNTLALLIGMMVIVGISEKSGMFQYLAIFSTQIVKASPRGILLMLGIITAVLSALLDNVTTVLLIVPVTFQITRNLKLSPYPYLILEIFSSNIGGTATLIGDPPNILIGSALNLSFTDFLITLAPVVILTTFVLILAFSFIWKNALQTTDRNKAAIMRMNAKANIVDKNLLYKSLFVLFLVITGFILAEEIHVANGVIALFGAACLLALYTSSDKVHHRDEKTEEMFNLVDWTTICFFAGLFMVVKKKKKTGVLELLGQKFVVLTHGSLRRATFIILGVSAFVSSAIDNIPFVATMIPMLKSMEESLGGREAMMPVWWALSLGACFGGNGSLIGASANVIIAGLASREGHPIKFLGFLLWSVPVMILSVLISGIYLYLKYFAF